MDKDASTVNWTTLDPCTSLSESDSKQFEFCDEIRKNNVDLQSQAIFVDKTNLKKYIHTLEDNANGCASGRIEQVIVKTLIEI